MIRKEYKYSEITENILRVSFEVHKVSSKGFQELEFEEEKRLFLRNEIKKLILTN